MTVRRLGILGLVMAASVGLAAQEPAPAIQNGRVERRTSATVATAIAAPVPPGEPVWIAWREPAVAGARGSCSTWTDEDGTQRGLVLDPSPGTNGRPQLAAETGPVQLESGTGVVLLLRVVDGRVERLRAVGDDCPIDANGRMVVWTTGISPAESLRYLDSLTQPASLTTDARAIALTAVAAMGLHRDPSADGRLDRLLANGASDDLRDAAARALARSRARHGFDAVSRALTGETDASHRQHLVTALSASDEAGVTDTLLDVARHDTNARVRADALYRYAVHAGSAGVAQVVEIAGRDSDQNVRRRAVAGLMRLPNHEGVPALLTLARDTTNTALRKEAVGELSRSDDPRAIAYLESLVR